MFTRVLRPVGSRVRRRLVELHLGGSLHTPPAACSHTHCPRSPPWPRHYMDPRGFSSCYVDAVSPPAGHGAACPGHSAWGRASRTSWVEAWELAQAGQAEPHGGPSRIERWVSDLCESAQDHRGAARTADLDPPRPRDQESEMGMQAGLLSLKPSLLGLYTPSPPWVLTWPSLCVPVS